MDSQNQDMYFTNLLSQDPQLAPTFGEHSGTSPLTFDDSPSLTPNNLIGQKKSIRGVNFTHEEDKLLVSAWLNCSLDAVQGTDQKQNQFWEKIFVYFQQYKQTTIERTIKSLSLRWSCIQRATNKFCSTLSQVEGLNQSGMTEQDKLAKTKIMYKELANEKMRLEAEKIELTKKESDQRIMMMDLSVMSEMQRQYFGGLQREIMRRCNQA